MPEKNLEKVSTKTREQILESAMEYFYLNGVKDLNESEFFKELGISPNEFYATYRNKEDILEQAVRHNMDRDRERNEKIREKSGNAVFELMSILKYGVDIIKRINRAYIHDIVNYYPNIMRIGAQNMQDYTLALYGSILNKGIKEGLFRNDINIQIVTRVITENAYVMINYRTFPPEKYHPGEVARSIYLYYFRGLCSPEGARLVDEFFAEHSF